MGERPLRLQKLKQQKMGCEEEVTLLRARISSLQHEFAEEQAAKEEIAITQSTTELEIPAAKNLEIMDLQESLRVATIERYDAHSEMEKLKVAKEDLLNSLSSSRLRIFGTQEEIFARAYRSGCRTGSDPLSGTVKYRTDMDKHCDGWVTGRCAARLALQHAIVVKQEPTDK